MRLPHHFLVNEPLWSFPLIDSWMAAGLYSLSVGHFLSQHIRNDPHPDVSTDLNIELCMLMVEYRVIGLKFIEGSPLLLSHSE